MLVGVVAADDVRSVESDVSAGMEVAPVLSWGPGVDDVGGVAGAETEGNKVESELRGAPFKSATGLQIVR